MLPLHKLLRNNHNYKKNKWKRTSFQSEVLNHENEQASNLKYWIMKKASFQSEVLNYEKEQASNLMDWIIALDKAHLR